MTFPAVTSKEKTRSTCRRRSASSSAPRWAPVFITNAPLSPETKIILTITRAGTEAFRGETTLSQLKRGVQELAGFLYRDNTFPTGALLMTGTGIVPGDEFTLQSGDEVAIAINGIGTLVNPMG